MIAPGAQLSVNFKVKTIVDGKIAAVDFGDLLTQRTIVSLYMRGNTPSCDRQVEALGAAAGEFARAGFATLAISRDTASAQQRLAEKKALGADLRLVSDPGDLFAQAADAVVDKVLYGKRYRGPARSAFVLSPQGIVLAVIEKVDVARHREQILEVLAGLGR
jgi:thioredoxin-dependent peroxiredoxin